MSGIGCAGPDLWAADKARPLFEDYVRVDTNAPVDVDGLAARVSSHPRWDGGAAASRPVVIVVAGLPGTGKSTIAAAISEATVAPVFARDAIGAALTRVGVTPSGDPEVVAFELLGVLAVKQLQVGIGAILDSVGGYQSTRARWRELAARLGVPLYVIECVCSDERIHRERLDARRRGIPGWGELDWPHVESVRARYEPWREPRLVLEAVDRLEANIAEAIQYIRGSDGPSIRR